MNVQQAPTFERNSWLDNVGEGELPTFDRVEDDLAVDWLIVGAGFTGAAAARQIALAKPDDSVLVIDAGEILDGSSSRSSGFVVPIGHFYHPKSDENRKLYQLGGEGIAWLRELANQHEIECGWNDAGRLIGARCEAGLKSLEMIRRSLEVLGSPIAEFSAEQIHQHTGMVGYRAAIQQTESVMVNPAMLLRGLIESLPSNVTVMANSKVASVIDEDGVRLSNGARIKAGKTILAVNAFANQLGVGRNRVFPMRTFVSVLEVPVAVGQDPAWGITSSERVGSSIRRVGNRLFIRNTAEFGLEAGTSEAELRKIAELQLCKLQDRFEGVADLHVENIWSGPISITANGASIRSRSKNSSSKAVNRRGLMLLILRLRIATATF